MTEMQGWVVIALLAWIANALFDPWHSTVMGILFALLASIASAFYGVLAYRWIRDERRRP